MFQRILIVCIGNICRSPTAEYLLRRRLGEGHVAQVSSAGLGALVDHPIDATALALLHEHGVDGDAHRARQLDGGMLRQSDLILAMEKSHVAAIVRMAPEASGKVFLFDRWREGRDVPDPYRQQRPAYEHVYGLIEEGVESWVRYL
ncbi:protein-tyrosine phosphatase [Luteibacter sp. UNCMF331Sha3.1]|uniref:low molecular weight protein-tyrosine-phosphatase n=1 Tax=Luteibacter sp. UNCMF331Sha3.1 TaxID=1502760 RepID=UPI0008B31E46|nr:low molecular weight protein-tyrosine-phosphatase [Luteibacter sp. UNCMF331Sha3.1]SEN21653.1 protein-tyrosine phosphatase [Luteibacter sp. UNCMF331Sha3.1]